MSLINKAVFRRLCHRRGNPNCGSRNHVGIINGTDAGVSWRQVMSVSQTIVYESNLGSTLAGPLWVIRREDADVCQLRRFDEESFQSPSVLYFRSSREVSVCSLCLSKNRYGRTWLSGRMDSAVNQNAIGTDATVFWLVSSDAEARGSCTVHRSKVHTHHRKRHGRAGGIVSQGKYCCSGWAYPTYLLGLGRDGFSLGNDINSLWAAKCWWIVLGATVI